MAYIDKIIDKKDVVKYCKYRIKYLENSLSPKAEVYEWIQGELMTLIARLEKIDTGYLDTEDSKVKERHLKSLAYTTDSYELNDELFKLTDNIWYGSEK